MSSTGGWTAEGQKPAGGKAAGPGGGWNAEVPKPTAPVDGGEGSKPTAPWNGGDKPAVTTLATAVVTGPGGGAASPTTVAPGGAQGGNGTVVGKPPVIAGAGFAGTSVMAVVFSVVMGLMNL